MTFKAALQHAVGEAFENGLPLLFKWSDEQFDNLLIAPPSNERPRGCRVRDSQWIFSEDLYPMTSPARRSINFRVPYDLAAEGRETLARSVKRYVVACMLWPLNEALDLASLKTRVRFFSLVCELIGNDVSCVAARQFSDVTLQSVVEATPRLLAGRSRSLRNWHGYLNELQAYGKIGAITDFFVERQPIVIKNDASNKMIGDEPKSRRGPQGPYQPFPDQYLSEAGQRWMFYIEQIGPNLVRIARDWEHFSQSEDLKVRKRKSSKLGDELAPSSVKSRRAERQKQYLRDFVWLADDGRPIHDIPFGCEGLNFPPTNFKQLTKLISLHQGAVFQISALLSAGRQGEVLTISRSSVDALSSGDDNSGAISFVDQRERKTSDRSAGTRAAWPVPVMLIPGLLNQAAISAVIHQSPSPYIWAGLNHNNFGGARIDPYRIISNFAPEHGLVEYLGDHANAHAHRFRKSLVRLAVLALDRAPAVLMTILGHVDLETTLGYILSHPDIRGELRTMLGEHRAEVALEVGEALDECAGPGAEALKKMRERYFDLKDVPTNERVQRRRQREFIAAMLMDGGTDLKIIFPGVICIKPLEANGKCRRKGRAPNPALCQINCSYRVDHPSRKPHVHAIIDDLIDDLSDPFVEASEFSGWWKAQLRDHILIFRDIHQSYMSDERVIRLLGRPL